MLQLTPDQIKIVIGLPPAAEATDKVAIDTEWFGMEKDRLHRPHGTFAASTFTYDGKTVYVVTDEKFLPLAMDRVAPAVHVYHNAKFDIGQVRRFTEYKHRVRMWDTMLVEQVRYSGYYSEGEFSLADLARRYLRLYMDKSVRAQFEGATELTQDMINYSAVDCAITWRVFNEQRKQIDSADLKVWKEIECPYTFVLLDMNGLLVDSKQWMEVANAHRAQADQIQAKYGKENIVIGPRGGKKKVWEGLNLSSHQQVKAHIIKLGYKVKDTNVDDIKQFAEECEFIHDLLEYREHDKAASTYGDGLLKFIEDDGRIHPDIRQMGAATGRPSMRRPNGQNIPNDHEHRACFIADPATDMVFVDGDWSAQEPRIFAYLCQDEIMAEIFRQKQDVYVEFARLGFGWNIDKSDPRRKDMMKPTVLGASYGLTEYGMNRKYGLDLETGAKLLDTFFRTFPGAAKYKREQRKAPEYVTTIYGRKYWLNKYIKGWENNTLNSPVQGSAADAMKIASVKFLDMWGWNDGLYDMPACPIVNEVHDEILLEVSRLVADSAAEMLRKAMIETAEAMHKGIPADVEIHTALNWADAH